MHKTEPPLEKAEGDIHLPGHARSFPYNTFSTGPNGCHIHVWMGDDYYGPQGPTLRDQLPRYCLGQLVAWGAARLLGTPGYEELTL